MDEQWLREWSADECEYPPVELREEVGELLTELDRLRALAVAVERYLAGGQTTAGLRELYAAREALRWRAPTP